MNEFLANAIDISGNIFVIGGLAFGWLFGAIVIEAKIKNFKLNRKSRH